MAVLVALVLGAAFTLGRMRNGLIAFVLFVFGAILVGALVATAHDSSSHLKRANTVDELAALENACGKPSRIENHRLGPHQFMEDAIYPRLAFRFERDGEEIPAWTSVGVFPRRGNDTIGRSDAVRLMPCVSGVHFDNELFEKN